ncbi:hypothetical protein AAG906_028452 [Vitis piasezkii]
MSAHRPPSIGDGTAGFDEGRRRTRSGPVRKKGPHHAAFCAESNGGRPGVPGVRRQYSPQETAKGGSAREHYIVKDLPIYKEFKEVDAEKRRALLDDREKRKNEGTLRKAPGQKRGAASPPKKAPAKKRKLVKNGKGVKEPTPPKEFVPPPITHEAEVMIEEPVNAAPHSISSGPGHVAGKWTWRRLPV